MIAHVRASECTRHLRHKCPTLFSSGPKKLTADTSETKVLFGKCETIKFENVIVKN